MTWSARQYAAFEDERTRPVRDLVAALPEIRARRAIDLGCGPGNSTEVLAARFPEAEVSGLDSSSDMVEAARARMPGTSFAVADIEQWNDPGPFDVILANAVFQWLPDHETLFPALVAKLDAGGGLAIQMPDNLDEPAHRLMREVAAAGPWAAKLAAAAASRTSLPSAAAYHRLLKPVCRRVDVWRTTYHHALEGGAGAIVEWFKGSGLRPFLAPLDPDARAAYLERYTAAVAKAYPASDDGTVLLPFPRLFLAAIR
ncbi:MAG TPA: trans-aconitate 2-methyltransferase [Steroidobacteraceae bacterium]|jgi:trans-aconitate 2-methyltransferase|nr:trans-aconitate 2-methyltransferase [Steroidobacteraceae bacterium]